METISKGVGDQEEGRSMDGMGFLHSVGRTAGKVKKGRKKRREDASAQDEETKPTLNRCRV